MRRLRLNRFRLATLSGVATLCLLALAACEDPSGVGLTVIDPGENDPSARSIVADSTSLSTLADVTGAFATAQGFSSFVSLAGRVDDPLFGTTTAYGFLDVLPPQSLPDGFRNRPIEQATLRLNRTYVYGDTTVATRLELRQIAEAWNAIGAEADTLFPVMDGIITSFDVAAGDSLVEVALPAEWVMANDTTLRSTSASTLFHGFRLSPSAPASAVYGFAGASTLELISQGDTVRYGVSELFSGIEGPAEPPAAPELLLLQDGTSRGLEIRFDLSEIQQSSINAVFLRVDADTAAVEMDRPAGFARPFARQLALYGFIEGEDPVFISSATLDEETQTFSFTSTVLTGLFQDLVLDRSDLDGFALGFLPARSTLDVLPLRASSEAGCEADAGISCRGPRATVFLIPSDD